jgi:hypothetical protein
MWLPSFVNLVSFVVYEVQTTKDAKVHKEVSG